MSNEVYETIKRGLEDAVNGRVTEVEYAPVVHGKWIDIGWNGDLYYKINGVGNCWHEWKCSRCNFISKGANWNYCPNCGAKMDGEVK